MKKIIALAMSLILMIVAFAAAEAETGEETLDIAHNTAMIWLDNTAYEFTLDSLSQEDGLILASFEDSSSGLILIMAMQNDLSVGYYEAAETRDSVYAMVIFESDDINHYSVCDSDSFEANYGCDLCMTVWNKNGWYQGLVIGNTICETNGQMYEITSAFDFVMESSEHNSNSCSTCKGTGTCIFCNNGNCVYCAKNTNYCYCNNGRCYICNGTGYTRGYSYDYGVTYDDCSSCGGNGIHTYCGGTGRSACPACYDTGICSHCYGTTTCYDCYGTGVN